MVTKTSLNGNLLKIASYFNTYTVAKGQTRKILITANDLGIPSSSDIRSVIASNCSDNPSIYFVSNTQWNAGIGVYTYISNNSSQSDIPIMVTILYI